MRDYIQVMTTASSVEEAQQIARTLVERRLAACVQVLGPIRSSYWWQGKVETDEEWQCAAKTRRDLFEDVVKTIKEVHSYEVPEILAVPVAAGSQPYLEWLESELAEPSES